MTTPQLDPISASDGSLAADSSLAEPRVAPAATVGPRPVAPLPVTKPIVSVLWHLDNNISWYGPGFYGRRTACGYAYTQTIVGVAHRTLPCGTLVTFRNPANGRQVTARVIDRGPYVTGRQWDMSAGLCTALGHCYTGSIEWRWGKTSGG